MQFDLTSVQKIKLRNAFVAALAISDTPVSLHEHALEARMELMMWDDHYSVAEVYRVAEQCTTYLQGRAATIWQASALQVSRSAGVSLPIAEMALRLLGAYSRNGMWTTWMGQILNNRLEFPKSAFSRA